MTRRKLWQTWVKLVSSEEESPDSRHFFHFPCCSDPVTNSAPQGRRDHWLCGCLRHDSELVPSPKSSESYLATIPLTNP